MNFLIRWGYKRESKITCQLEHNSNSVILDMLTAELQEKKEERIWKVWVYEEWIGLKCWERHKVWKNDMCFGSFGRTQDIQKSI